MAFLVLFKAVKFWVTCFNSCKLLRTLRSKSISPMLKRVLPSCQEPHKQFVALRLFRIAENSHNGMQHPRGALKALNHIAPVRVIDSSMWWGSSSSECKYSHGHNYCTPTSYY